MLGVVVTVVLALLTALGTLAVKFPRVFVPLDRSLQFANAAVCMGIGIYQFALIRAGSLVLPYIKDGSAGAVLDALDPGFHPLLPMAVWIAMAAYITFLHWLAVQVHNNALEADGDPH